MTAQNGNIRLILKLVLAAAVIGTVAVVALQRFSDPVVVAPVKLDKAVSAVPGSVVVFADKGIRELKSEAAGRVEFCETLDPGRAFKKGELLLKLDTSELEREISELKRDFASKQEKRQLLLAANIDKKVAQENLDNAERFQKRGDVSAEAVKGLRRVLEAVESRMKIEEFDNVKAKDDFKAMLDAKNIQLEKMKIIAREDGVVEGVTVFNGALINAGTAVATFTSPLRVVTAKISEENFGSIKLGQKAKVRLLIYPSEDPFDATVSKILPSAEENTQRYTIYLDVAVDPARLKHNSTGQVNITVGERENQPLIPRRALFNSNQVFVAKDGRLEKREVDLGFVSLSSAEIKKGLKPGELVVVENLDQFRDGQRVRIPVAK